MNGWKASWRIALRHGRRDIAKARGRSALVVLMIGTPVLLTVLLTVIVASSDLSAKERQTSELGQAQASLTRVEAGKVVQEPDGSDFQASGKPLPVAVARARAEKVLGTSLGPSVDSAYGTLRIGERGLAVDVRGIDTTSDLTRGMYTVDEGRAPRSAQEILVNRPLADAGASVGSRVEALGKSFTVVGVGRPSSATRGGRDGAALVLPQDLDEESSVVLVGGRPVTWPQVLELNRLGYLVSSTYVAEHGLTAAQRSALDEAKGYTNGGGATSTERAVYVIAASSVMIEVILLACPAFAVGVRRQRRELALLAATGATPRQVRRVVLGQAAVLGGASSVVAAGLGVGLAALVVRLGPDLVTPLELGPFDVRWWAVALVVVLGTVAAVGAAYVPAVQASRQDVATVLAGRRGEVRTRAGWPIAGALLAAVGVAVCFTLGTRVGGEVMVAGSTLAIVLGFVMMTPALVGVVGRLGTNLPLPLRLAARDTARQRSRSAPAVAAVMASVAGITAVAIGSASDFQQSREEYQYSVAPGRAQVVAEAADFDRVLALVDERTGESWVPMAIAQKDDAYVYVEGRGHP
ncbi:MAG: ABC transporter permease [Actinomycetales bacterium]|nr:MAG: ABC transporter permease [Actinomycetales bacterium]